jgi:hypothetical protein
MFRKNTLKYGTENFQAWNLFRTSQRPVLKIRVFWNLTHFGWLGGYLPTQWSGIPVESNLIHIDDRI